MSAPVQPTDRLRESLVAIRQLKSEIDRLRASASEPIAVLGIGCRFPGGATSPDAFWSNLRDGVDAIVKVPLERWDADRLYDPDPRAPGKACTRYGGFIQNVDVFDASFFGISPREAARLDPQHRLLLEVAWEALEGAAINPHSLHGSPSGVFVGICSSDYAGLALRDLDSIDAYLGTGNAHSTAAGRLSFFLGLRGPSLAVDTACSSSLVSVHLACQSLRAGECDLALAGGVNLMLSPALTINFSQAGMLAPDGRCKAFDARADGYARGEGCGMIVLKRLSDALAASHPIVAVLRGSAVNQDGKSSGLTVPNGLAQVAVIRQALVRAGVAPLDVGFVEAHGTGTALGDPIEMRALREVYAKERSADWPLVIGALKGNIGHLEGAAGIAGLIKAILCLQHAEIPANLHMRELNPQIELDGAAIEFPGSQRPWTTASGRRIAGVSSFGFGGTNAHVIVENAPTLPSVSGLAQEGPHLLALSARTGDALDVLARRYAHALAEADDAAAVCHTSQVGRAHFEQRLAVVGDDCRELRMSLEGCAAGKVQVNLVRASASAAPKVAFLFTGQGSQFPGMGRELYDCEPVFRATIDRCDEILRSALDVPLHEILYPSRVGADLLAQTQYAQPALVAVAMALAELWRSWGIRPAAVLGHSVGEFAAACVSGAMELEDGLRLVAERGALMQAVSSDGAMASVFAERETVQGDLDAFGSGICIAADNGPRHIVVSGGANLVDEFLEKLARKKIAFRRLDASTAFHSPWIRPIEGDWRTALHRVRLRVPSTTFVSTVTGGPEREAIVDSEYWVGQAFAPTEFACAIRSLPAQGCTAYLEIGPQPTLVALGQACLPDARGPWLPSLRRRDPDRRRMRCSLGALYVHGADVAWHGLHKDSSIRKVPLPTYPFERKRHWLTETSRKAQAAGTLSDEGHPPHGVLGLIRAGRIDAAVAEFKRETTLAPEFLEKIPALLASLASLDLQQRVAREAAQCLYSLEWQASSGARVGIGNAASLGVWVMFCDRSDLAEHIGKRLEQGAATVVRVRAATKYSWNGADEYGLSEGNSEHCKTLIASLVERRRAPMGVIHLWGTSATAETFLDPPGGNADALLVLVRALLEAHLTSPVRLWLVTRCAVSVDASDSPPALAAAPSWGLVKSLAVERQDVVAGAIDLGAATGALAEQEAEHLVGEFVAPDRDRFIALRGQRRMVARLHPLKICDWSPVRPRHDRTYLIAGGTGALGLHVADLLVRRGARYLALVSRGGLISGPAQATVEEWRRAGVVVQTYRVDVGDPQQMKALGQTIVVDLPPLAGIVHAAGELVTEPIETLEPEMLRLMLRAKLAGGWLLHTLAAGCDLDFFVCFSSTASVWGSPGLAAYSAANQCLDSLAHYRRRLGLTALSVNWGPWEHAGMASATAEAALARIGISALPTAWATTALEYLIASGHEQATVARVDWKMFAQLYAATTRLPLLEAMAKESAPGSGVQAVSGLSERLRLAPPRERRRLLTQFVREQVARILKLDEVALPDPKTGFFDLGMDSLMKFELRTALEAALGHALPATIGFDFPNVDSLASYLLSEFFEPRAASLPEPRPAASAHERPVVATDSLTETELAGLLAARIRSAKIPAG